MMGKAILTVWALVLALALGCAITDYPEIIDDRGDYSGLIRTGHKAYIIPSFTGATVYPDGSDELYSMVYQNQYGDQSIYTFNNFDPSGAVIFLDQTYCDWKFDDCELARAWDPVQNDDRFDYEFFEDCSGARSLGGLIAYTDFNRVGECGDHRPFGGDLRGALQAFSDLGQTSWRGAPAYHLPIEATTFSATLESTSGKIEQMPIYGGLDVIVTEELQLVVPMTPNARHQLNWLRGWVDRNGPDATLRYDYGGFVSELDLRIRADGLSYNAGRF
jgi:hypothetical protein